MVLQSEGLFFKTKPSLTPRAEVLQTAPQPCRPIAP